MKIDKTLLFTIEGKLNIGDTQNQTYGCRYYNPEICKNFTSNTCAFMRDDKICKTPSKKWKKIYNSLLEPIEDKS